MTADELMDMMNKLNNKEKNQFLDKIYDNYFDKRIPAETLMEHIRILEMYYSGELIEM